MRSIGTRSAVSRSIEFSDGLVDNTRATSVAAAPHPSAKDSNIQLHSSSDNESIIVVELALLSFLVLFVVSLSTSLEKGGQTHAWVERALDAAASNGRFKTSLEEGLAIRISEERAIARGRAF